jgi:hypothetical protein
MANVQTLAGSITIHVIVAGRRQALLLVALSVVVGVHLIIIWLLVSSPRLLLRTKSGSLQLVWIPRPALPDSASQPETTAKRPKAIPSRNHVDRSPAMSSIAPRSVEEDNAIHPVPDWTEELHLSAKNAVANQLAQKRHELDFAHAFPAQPKRPPQFAWDYAATHRIEAIPEGGMLVHLGDNCVLILFPLPFVGCAIGKRAANRDLFEHRSDQ